MVNAISFQIVCGNEIIPTEQEMQQWVEAALPPSQDHEINIRLVTATEMQSLNKDYRKKDNVTDILSFPFTAPGFETNELGDIVLCPARINEDAKKQNKEMKHHWAHLLVHGTLHLLGFDHYNDADAEVMIAREIAILNILNIQNPYES